MSTKKTGTQPAFARERRILTPAEREGLKQRIAENEEDTQQPQNRNLYIPERLNDPLERATVAREKRVLAEGEPDSLSRAKKIKMERQAKIYKEWLQRSMVPKSHVNLKPSPSDPSFRMAVNEMAKKENSREFQDVAKRFKNIMRELHPNDPHLSNLETIRPNNR